MAATEHPSKIFVGNLPFSTTTNSFAGLFRPFGTVVGAKLVEDRGTGKKKGFGFITFQNPDSVERAIAEMHGNECEGRRLTVKHATLRGEKGVYADIQSDEDCGALDQAGPEQVVSQDGDWGVVRSRATGRETNAFKKRAAAVAQTGKVLGWGSGDDDWA
mmetsp:Transcript_84552/g.235883  ORF Transcript_84552/g.235883 Transcript_84552/m.235883 type:complete len:160 (+) Transcript_84552:62-541(+)